MLDIDQLVADCRAALADPLPAAAARDVLARVVRTPSAVIARLGEPRLAGVETLYCAADLTVLNIAWAPGMTLHPHDHCMWATIGIYGGREENRFYRRSDVGLQTHGVKELNRGDAIRLGDSIIHSVSNPLTSFTAALHVYGGDFFATPRSEWDPETLIEQPYDVEHMRQVFADANAGLVEGG